MKRVLIAMLLLALSATGVAQTSPAQVAISARAAESARASNAQQAAHYAENRQRCEAALRIAEQCGKFAGKFSCDEKGFKPIAPDATNRPVARDPYKVERCA